MVTPITLYSREMRNGTPTGVVLTPEVNAMTKLILCVLFLLAPLTSAAGEIIRVGEQAPPFSLPDLFGRTIPLGLLRRSSGRRRLLVDLQSPIRGNSRGFS